MSREAVTLEKAIESIRSAADELSTDEFIDYSVILDVHLNWALEELSPEDQYEFLHVLEEVLASHEGLARSIAWDLVIVLLPYLESPLAKTVEITESLIASAAKNGNPREVYIKVLQGLSSLPWSPGVESEDEDEDEDEDEGARSGDDGTEYTVPRHRTDGTEFAKHALNKFRNLLSALETVHPRISAKFPSKFLSTELSTLLVAFTRAVEVVDNDAVTGIAERILSFLKIVRPQLSQIQAQIPNTRQRPPLPPRTSTSASIIITEQEQDSDALDDQLQARLIASFLSHVVSGYLLRTRQQSVMKRPPLEYDSDIHEHPSFGGFDGPEERGLEVGWAGKYDEEVLRPDKSRVPGGRTLIDVEREGRAANVKALVDEISSMCEILGLKTQELLELCQVGADLSDDEDDEADIPAPRAAAEVPLSKQGALFLLANRLSSGSSTTPHFQIYPEHSAIAEAFMIYSTGQYQPPVIDAILFLGELALQTGGLGSIPELTEDFFIYLQIFSVISTNAQSPQGRFLANSHVARCLRAHPNEAVRLAYVRDTLEHCPFESVKAAVVGILKDEIIHASTPALKEGTSEPSTPNSIFGTGLCLSEIFDVLFPDLEKVLAGEGSGERAWEKFKELHPRFTATLNLYLLLLLNNELCVRLGVAESTFGEKVEERFLAPVRTRAEEFKVLEEKERGSINMLLLEMTMRRVEKVRESIVEE